MNITYLIDDPLEYFLRKKNLTDKFNEMLQEVTAIFSLIMVSEENNAAIIFFLTKKTVSKKTRSRRRLAKKRSISIPLLSCQEMITRHKEKSLVFIKARIIKMLIWPITNNTDLEEAEEIALDCVRRGTHNIDPIATVAARRLGGKKFRKIIKKAS